MNYHILIITSTYLCQYMKDTLGTPPENVLFRFVEYQQFTDLKNIYQENEKWADGILTTGIVVQTVLERDIGKLTKPILSLDTDNESFYRIPLTLLIENRSLDPERIIFDVFVNVDPNPSVLSLLEKKNIMHAFPEFSRWLEEATIDELYRIEEATLKRIKNMWDSNSIDMVICRYSSLVPRLKELHIPCVFATGTDEYVCGTMQHLLAKIKIEKITAHAPAVISITPKETKNNLWTERLEVTLQKCLMDFAQKNDLDFLLQKKREHLLVLTEKAIISYITEDFKLNHLAAYLEDNIDFNLSISYGIGNTIDEAMTNAQTAFTASGISGDSFLVDEEKKLIGPLSAEKRTISSDIISPHIQELAQKASLSTTTIHRLIRLLILLGRKEITSSDLAENFHISLRGANRILQQLEKNGLASASFQKSSHMRGRPAKIYTITLDT